MSLQKTERRLTPELPANLDDWTLKVSHEPTLNDLVHDIHKLLMRDEATNNKYRALLRATHDSEAVEGCCTADNLMCAQMIRDRAVVENTPVKDHNLWSIHIALNVVTSRYNMSRKQRRNQLGGEQVSDNNGE